METSQDSGLSALEIDALRRLAGVLIPPDAALAMPGADDPDILADLLATLGRDQARVQAALGALLAAGFAAAAPAEAETLARSRMATAGPEAGTLGRVILQCYYRDPRVLRALGQDPRPPFPGGHVLEQGDWSLLDPVRARDPFWRDDRAGAA